MSHRRPPVAKRSPCAEFFFLLALDGLLCFAASWCFNLSIFRVGRGRPRAGVFRRVGWGLPCGVVMEIVELWLVF